MTLRRTLSTAAALALALPGAWASAGSASTSGPQEGGPATGFRDRWVQRGPYRIHAREQAGAGPTIVLMHGYPDNHHLYDRLVPHLRGRHALGFDFLGCGESDKPKGHDYTFDNHKSDLHFMIPGLGLHK